MWLLQSDTAGSGMIKGGPASIQDTYDSGQSSVLKRLLTLQTWQKEMAFVGSSLDGKHCCLSTKNSKTQLEAQHSDACEVPVYKPN